MNRPVAFGLRLYRRLASAFPYEFQCAYGDELLLTTEDAIEDIWRRHGVFGLVRLLLDIAIRVPVEHLAELRQDIRYGLRSLRSSPGFTAVALISLTLGIGVASSAFSEMNGFILRDVPAVASPNELVTLHETIPYPSYQIYRQRTDLFSASFAYLAPVPFGVAFGGHTERMWGHAALVGVGTLLGIAGARAGMRALSGFIAEVARVAGSSTSDPVLLAGAPLLLGAIALAACYVPARKSMRIDPAVTLRQE